MKNKKIEDGYFLGKKTFCIGFLSLFSSEASSGIEQGIFHCFKYTVQISFVYQLGAILPL